jgi:hypothetical protein
VPVPLAGVASVIQDVPLEAVHEHPVVTPTL